MDRRVEAEPLARYIAAHREPLTAAIRTRIAEIPELSRLPPAALIDHLPEFLGELAAWIAGDRDAEHRAYLHLIQGHALHRFGHGIELATLLQEYQVLREVLLEELITGLPGGGPGQALVEFNKALDLAISESVRRFTAQRDVVRERFVGILGHDLRNPLTALILAAEHIVDTPCSQASHARLSAAIRRGGERMGRMIADVLDFALGQLGGGIPVVPQTCDMGEICREAVDEQRATHPDRRLSLTVDGDLVGSWDRDRAVQAISNLVANALVHGEDPITVRVHEEPGRQFVVTEVHNEGSPIDAAAIETLFDAFRRGATARRGGLGLGLYIVQQIALAHGAQCTVESAAEHGTTFRIRWPRAPLDEVARPFQTTA